MDQYAGDMILNLLTQILLILLRGGFGCVGGAAEGERGGVHLAIADIGDGDGVARALHVPLAVEEVNSRLLSV